MGKKGKKAQAGKPKKLTPKEIGKRLDALAKKLEEELKGADLFAPLPPAEDCAICCVPLPRVQSAYLACCGNEICSGCVAESEAYVIKQNAKNAAKRKEDKKLMVDPICPFCREPIPASIKDYIRMLENRVSKNDPLALYNIGVYYDDGSCGLPTDKIKALHYWTRAAELGNPYAMTNIGVRYNYGTEVPVDKKKAAFFYRASALNGFHQGRHNLGFLEYHVFGNHELGIRHWKIAAEAGHQPSLNWLRKVFNANGEMPGKDCISKEDLDRLYRACHDAQEEFKSEGRKKHEKKDDIFKC